MNLSTTGIRCFLIEPIFGERRAGEPGDYGEKVWDSRVITAWRRADTGEEKQHCSEFPAGAMWFAVWYWKNHEWSNQTGPDLMVRCPNGPDRTRDWNIDSRASNCDLPNDNLHRCWVRHGTPPNITVDKKGLTCLAGAGSIALPNWHGFLTNGILDTRR